MSWKNLKYFAIVVLLLMNVFFGASVISQNHNLNYYSDEEIDTISDVLKKSGIYISRGILEEKKQRYSVYTRDFSEKAAGAVARKICKTELSRGENYFEFKAEKETRRYYDDFSFAYVADGAVAPKTELSASGTAEIITTEEHEKIFNEIAKKFMNIQAINSSSENKGALKTDVMLYRLFYNKTDGFYVATFVQYFGGIAGENEFNLVIDGENVISGDGTFAILLPSNEKRAECTDIVNILFKEKRTADKTFGSGEYPVQLISSIVYEYDIYYDAERTCYYVPVCNLIYSDGTTHSYNLIDGEKR